VRKRTITVWYVVAWLVWLAALVAIAAMSRGAHGSGSTSVGLIAAYVVMVVAGLLTVVMWVTALLMLARQKDTSMFVWVLVLQLVGLGILGMAAFALTRPAEPVGYITRPSMT
jgi:hypothetical protein